MSSSRPFFRRFHPEWEDTRSTLHAYAHAVTAVARSAAIPHPKWWHVSLKLRPEGLTTDPTPITGGGTLAVVMNLNEHVITLRSSSGATHTFSMREGMTGTQMGDALVAAAAEAGLEAPVERARFANDDARAYEPAAASGFFEIATNAGVLMRRQRAKLGASTGPIQIWPHGFDLAFEWFGTREVSHIEDGNPVTQKAQINFGLYPGGEPYFYSNPWPFETASLVGHDLPEGATWHDGDWQGSTLPYSVVADAPFGSERVVEFFARVYELAAPTLSSPSGAD